MTVDPPCRHGAPGPGAPGLDSFAGRPVAVLGLARSGVALARFLADRGARVTVYDGARGRAGGAIGPSGAARSASGWARSRPGGGPAGQALVTTSPP